MTTSFLYLLTWVSCLSKTWRALTVSQLTHVLLPDLWTTKITPSASQLYLEQQNCLSIHLTGLQVRLQFLVLFDYQRQLQQFEDFLLKLKSSLYDLRSCLYACRCLVMWFLLWWQSSLLHASSLRSLHSLALLFVCLFANYRLFLTPVPTLWWCETYSSLHTLDTLLHTDKHTHTHTISHLHSIFNTRTHSSPCVQLPLLYYLPHSAR